MIPMDFHFERPWWLLALVPAAVVLWSAARAAVRGSGWRDTVDAHLLRHLALPAEGGRRAWPLWLLGAGWLAATLAMAGPSWERVRQPTTKTIEPTVVALDMSVSMDATDLTPSRLARARYELQDVLERNAGGQVGLVIYSDEPFVAAPLTDDGRVVAEMIPTLTSDIMPGRGSRPDRAIDQAVALLEQAGIPGGRILLLADSVGDDPAATSAAARRAAASGRRVSVLGVGTVEGAPIPDGRGGFARTKDGETHVARLPVDALRSLSVDGGGRYASIVAGDADLDVLLAEPLSLASSSEDGARWNADVEIWRDAGVYLLFVPLLLAPLAFRRGWLAVLALGVALGTPLDARAGVWDDLWYTRDQQAAAALETGDATRASELFESEDWRAAARYESGDFEEASQEFAALDGNENRYNLGNALAKSGKLEAAIAAYDEVLEAAPGHEDAEFNRELVRQLLEQRRQEPQEQRPQEQGQEQSGDGSGEESPSEHSQRSSGTEPSESSASDGSSGSGSEPQAQADAADESDEPDPSAPPQANAEQEPGEPQKDASQQATAEEQPGEASTERRDAAGEPGDERSPEEYADRGKPEHGAETGENAVGERVDEALEANEGEPQEDEPGSQRASAPSAEPMTEERQAREQLLRQVPDDPAGLLRAKIHRTYAEKRFAERQRRIVQQGGTNPWW